MSCSENQYAITMDILREFHPGSQEADLVEEIRTWIDSLWSDPANRPALVEARTRLEELPLLVEAVELQRARVRAHEAALRQHEDHLQSELAGLRYALGALP